MQYATFEGNIYQENLQSHLIKMANKDQTNKDVIISYMEHHEATENHLLWNLAEYFVNRRLISEQIKRGEIMCKINAWLRNKISTEWF